MLEFLKKIFKNEEETTKKVTEINLQNLEEWLIEKSKPLMEETQQQIEEILMKVNEELQRGRINVEILENAKLQNPNIPFKAKQYMEGNRKAYIRAINSFLGHMDINNRDYFYLIDFCKLFDELIDDLNKGTLRSYTILQEFFANETGKIAENLKNFYELFNDLKSVLNSEKVVSVNDARQKARNLSAKTRQKINFDIDFKNAEVSLKLANEEKDSVMAGITSFSKSDAHNNFMSFSEEKKNKERDFYKSQSQILQSFSVLERPLRKYSHIAFEHEEIVLDYLKQPIDTLVNDKEMRIAEVLKNMEKLLKENQIQLDEKKKEKSLEETKRLNKEFLEEFVKKYYSFKSEIEEIDNKIKMTNVPEKFRDFNKQLEGINLRIEKDNGEFEKLKNDVTKINNSIESLKNEIESDVKRIFGEEVKIIV